MVPSSLNAASGRLKKMGKRSSSFARCVVSLTSCLPLTLRGVQTYPPVLEMPQGCPGCNFQTAEELARGLQVRVLQS